MQKIIPWRWGLFSQFHNPKLWWWRYWHWLQPHQNQSFISGNGKNSCVMLYGSWSHWNILTSLKHIKATFSILRPTCWFRGFRFFIRIFSRSTNHLMKNPRPSHLAEIDRLLGLLGCLLGRPWRQHREAHGAAPCEARDGDRQDEEGRGQRCARTWRHGGDLPKWRGNHL